MAQYISRKTPTGHAANAPIIFSDGEDAPAEDDQQHRRDSQWVVKSPQEYVAERRPTTCFGHFDRLDIEYTPKPGTKPRVIVYHAVPIASWASRPPLHKDYGGNGTAGGLSEVHDRGSLLPDDDLKMSGALPPATPDEITYDAPIEKPTSLRNTLMALRVQPTAQPLTITQDPYFAGRLAAISVIMLLDGLDDEAQRLGQWSVNLVGQEEWEKMVEYHGSAARSENDDWEWMAYLLGEIDVNLRQVDEAASEQLRAMIVEWQEMGVLPSDRGLDEGGQ